MAWLDPLTYHTKDDQQLPYQLSSERDIIAKMQQRHTPSQTAAAKKLTKYGLDRIWDNYVAQYRDQFGDAKGRAAARLMNSVLDQDGELWTDQKGQYREPRPYEVGVKKHGDSFPSGHASTAYAAAEVLGRLWPERADEFKSAAANTARSRVYLGDHFAGDVAAGARQGVKVADAAMRRH
jgi:hypothetical protein